MEQETQKIKELDDQYASELREWKQQLVPRKQVRSQQRAKVIVHHFTLQKSQIRWSYESFARAPCIMISS